MNRTDRARSEPKYIHLPETQLDDQSLGDQFVSNTTTWKPSSFLCTFISGLILGALLAVLCLIIVIPLLSASRFPTVTPTRQFAPEIPLTTTVMFERIHGLEPPLYDIGQKIWMDLVPDQDRLVYIPDAKLYNLPPSISTETGIDGYQVAMFHQLHCMGMIHEIFWTFISHLNGTEPDSQVLAKLRTEVYNKHPQHCFEYMVQSIMCSADLTIEWARTNREGKRVDFDGWNIPHQCKDPAEVRAWVKSNHQTHAENLLKMRSKTSVLTN